MLRTSVFLREIRVRKDGTIFMNATWAFINAVRTRVGSAANTHLRVGTFDFAETRTNNFVGVPDEFDANSKSEAVEVACHILAIYRSILLFEAIFAEPGSYNSWMLFNRRAPTPRDLATLGRTKGVYVPFMALPFKQPKIDLVALLETVTRKNSVKIRVQPKAESPVKPMLASPAKLAALAAAYQRS